MSVKYISIRKSKGENTVESVKTFSTRINVKKKDNFDMRKAHVELFAGKTKWLV